jgi:methyltransferase-like protein 6
MQGVGVGATDGVSVGESVDESPRAAQYFDCDFTWETAAAARHEACAGALAPPLEDAGRVVELTSSRALRASWERFYAAHGSGAYKSRSYLEHCFPQLRAVGDGALLCEIGCGTGAGLLPLLRAQPRLCAHAVDLSAAAVHRLETELARDAALAARCRVEVCDATQALPFTAGAAAAVLLVFTLSAVPRAQQAALVRRAADALRPGGHLLLRDYGLYDMVQARCRRRVGDCAYIKEDGIHCVFFSLHDVDALAAEAGLAVEHAKYCTVRNVNRKTKSTFDRVFINAVLVKPSTPTAATEPCGTVS